MEVKNLAGSTPYFSIILAVYNDAQNLSRCIESFASQDYAAKELIIIDGGSTDGFGDVIKANKKFVKYWESKPDRGIYHAWNKALPHCEGDWINFLGADDRFFSSDVVSRVAAELRTCPPKAGIVYGKIAVISARNDVLEYKNEPWEKTRPRFMAVGDCLKHQAVFHHRDLFKKYGAFDESFRICGDYDFLLRVLKHEQAVCLEDIVIKATGLGGVSTAPEKGMVVVREIARAKKKNGVFVYHPSFLAVFIKAFIKKNLQQLAGKGITHFCIDLYRKLTGRSDLWTKSG